MAELLKQDDLTPAIQFLKEAQAAPAALRLREAIPDLLRLSSARANPCRAGGGRLPDRGRRAARSDLTACSR